MNQNLTVSHEAWLEARQALLAREKAFVRERDALSAARRALPREHVSKPYVFEGALGSVGLASLFAGTRQLIVYHFMFAAAWQQGCKSCSFVADHFDGTLAHLAARDTTLVAVSSAPFEKLAAFRERMGWSFAWYSSADSTFNHDFQVTFDDQTMASGSRAYNYGSLAPPLSEMPGFSVFVREGEQVLHSYSSYGRGVELAMNTYNLLDITPAGRHEDAQNPMSWVRHHDRYGTNG